MVPVISDTHVARQFHDDDVRHNVANNVHPSERNRMMAELAIFGEWSDQGAAKPWRKVCAGTPCENLAIETRCNRPTG